MRPRYTRVPWDLPQSDLDPAGQPELIRDLAHERQLAMHVTGSVNPGLSLGLVALRCTRRGDDEVPLTLSIPETPIVMEVAQIIAQSSPVRRRRWRDMDYWREEGA